MECAFSPYAQPGLHPLRSRPRGSEKTMGMAAKRFKKDQVESDAIRADYVHVRLVDERRVPKWVHNGTAIY